MPKWLLFSLFTVLLWGVWGVISKVLASSVSAWQLQAISTVGMLPIIAILVWMSRRDIQMSGPSNRRAIFESFAAGLLGSLGNVAFFEALSVGGKAAAVTPITALYPIATIVLALIFLNERLSVVQAIGIVLSLVALYLFNVTDTAEILTAWLAFSLIPIVLWGVGGFVQKLATFRISSELCTLAFLLGFLPLGVIVVLKQPDVTKVSGEAFWLSTLVGFLFALGNLTVIIAYASGGKAAIVTPIAALYSLVTVPLAVAFLGENISGREGLAIAIALLAVIALCYERSEAVPVDRSR